MLNVPMKEITIIYSCLQIKMQLLVGKKTFVIVSWKQHNYNVLQNQIDRMLYVLTEDDERRMMDVCSL